MAQTVAALRTMAQPLAGFDALVHPCRDKQIVLIGEATHGTHEFYEARAAITRRLIEELGFNAVAIEGDWPDAARVHRFVTGSTADGDAVEALSGFRRFPTWMWRNTVVADFVGWLHARNHAPGRGAHKVGFYGIDLYSLHASMRAVLDYLERADRPAAARARERYACIEQFGEDAQRYGYIASLGISESCEREVLAQLVEMERAVRSEGFFDAEQNARLVANAERYYRTMYFGSTPSWNLRDTHMTDTIDAIARHLGDARIVVWAHNSHLGDARATEVSEHGELNVGQLVRERYGDRALSIGFTTYSGTVTAASDWDGIAQRKRVRRALPGSVEELFHKVGIERFLLDLRNLGEVSGALREDLLERAIGVVYRPDTERASHYFRCRIAEQFDFVLHYDTTRALEPIEREPRWVTGEPPETYPAGL